METTKQRYTLVMLDTEKASDIGIYNAKLYHSTSGKMTDDWQNQHLYITSMSKIVNGDLYFEIDNNRVLKCKSYVQEKCINEKPFSCRKVVASTDKELTPDCWIDLSKSTWIMDYCNHYKKLPDINLEMELFVVPLEKGVWDNRNRYEPKTNSDNSVIISSEIPEEIKYTHTRNDIAYHVHSVLSDVALHIAKTGRIDGFDSDKWIEENVK